MRLAKTPRRSCGISPALWGIRMAWLASVAVACVCAAGLTCHSGHLIGHGSRSFAKSQFGGRFSGDLALFAELSVRNGHSTTGVASDHEGINPTASFRLLRANEHTKIQIYPVNYSPPKGADKSCLIHLLLLVSLWVRPRFAKMQFGLAQMQVVSRVLTSPWVYTSVTILTKNRTLVWQRCDF
ncbi:hypothetical protein PhaeoP71_01496 [Phaeobacter piscinae]|nr:hypothetical protein PhaeoP71_01496 [Phaeobacter piscinae]